MTDDPIKLYVVVMAILVCVLGWVAHTSYQQAAAIEQAIADAPNDAKRLRDYAGVVDALCRQLSSDKLDRGFGTLIENAANANRIANSGFGDDPDVKLPGRVKEKRWKFQFRRSGRSKPLTRDEVARFCRQVELDSRGILKTIEIYLRRHQGAGGVQIGGEEIVNDSYTGHVIFGLRVLDER